MHPDLHISIVSYNTASLLDACLDSLASGAGRASLAVTVVDNGSTDGSPEMVRSRYPQFHVVETGANIGYGAANNAALRGTNARYVMALNSDTVVQPGSLDALVDFMDAHPEVGAAGAALILPGGEPQRNWAVGELTLAGVVWEQTFLAKLLPRSKTFGDYFRADWPRDRDTLVPQACGAALAIRAELFDKLGGFDPAIFMYAEDTDLCRRVRDCGSHVAFVAGARIVHHHGQSSAGSLRPAMIVEHNRSRIYYFAKHAGRAQALAARAVMAAGALLRALLWSALAAMGKKEAGRTASAFLDIAGATIVARVPTVRRTAIGGRP